MLNYEVRLLVRKEYLQIIQIYVLVIKPKVSDKLLYEDFSYLLFSVLRGRREPKSLPWVVNVEVVPWGHRRIKNCVS